MRNLVFPLFTIIEYPPEGVIGKRQFITLKGYDNIFVNITLNGKEIYSKEYVEGGSKKKFEIELEEGQNIITVKGKSLEGNITKCKLRSLCLSKVDVVVDKKYGGNEGEQIKGVKFFKSLKTALESIRDTKINGKETIVFVRKGEYKEKINIDVGHLTLIGEDMYETIVTYNIAAGMVKPENNRLYGTEESATVTVNGEEFMAENITFENSFDRGLPIGPQQAVAVRVSADRVVFRRCRFIGRQDTLFADKGRQYYKECYIEGDVDFIFGSGQAVFEDCIICSLDRPGKVIKGYVTAASTKREDKYGFLFTKCKLISNISKKGSVYLGRPWHPSNDPTRWVNVVFRECYLGDHIHPDGWTQMHEFRPEQERFYEYRNYGPGAQINPKRPQLGEVEQEMFTVEKIFGEWKVEEFIKRKYEMLKV